MRPDANTCWLVVPRPADPDEIAVETGPPQTQRPAANPAVDPRSPPPETGYPGPGAGNLARPIRAYEGKDFSAVIPLARGPKEGH